MAYSRKSRGWSMMSAATRESAARPNEEPAGMTTRTGAPCSDGSAETQAAAMGDDDAQAATSRRRRARRSGVQIERMAEKHGGGEGVDVPLSLAWVAAHLAHGAEGDRGGVALVDERDGESGPPLELGGDMAHLGGARRLSTRFVEREPDDELARLEGLGAAHDLRDRRPLPRAAHDGADGRGDRPRRIAHGEPDAALAPVDRQPTAAGVGEGHGRKDIGWGRVRGPKPLLVAKPPSSLDERGGRLVKRRARQIAEGR